MVRQRHLGARTTETRLMSDGLGLHNALVPNIRYFFAACSSVRQRRCRETSSSWVIFRLDALNSYIVTPHVCRQLVLVIEIWQKIVIVYLGLNVSHIAYVTFCLCQYCLEYAIASSVLETLKLVFQSISRLKSTAAACVILPHFCTFITRGKVCLYINSLMCSRFRIYRLVYVELVSVEQRDEMR